jgi:hypothetical protein
MNKKEEERILFLEKENEEKELKKKELNEIKYQIKKENLLKNLEKKAKLLEMKLKNEEFKNIYNEDNNKNSKKNVNNPMIIKIKI